MFHQLHGCVSELLYECVSELLIHTELSERKFMEHDILDLIVGFQIIICIKTQMFFKG